MSAVVYYAGETNTPSLTVEGKIYGRLVAIDGFLRAFANIDRHVPLTASTPTRDDALSLRRLMDGAGAGDRPLAHILPRQMARLAEIGCLFFYDSVLEPHLWARRLAGLEGAFSLCGLTHTSAGPAAAALAQLVTAPCHAWDAMICTSRAVKAMTETMLDGHAEYLAERLGGTGRCPIQLPVIPLGIDCAEFAAGPDDQAARLAWRARMGIGESDPVVLFVGRLSAHSKANPCAMYSALEETARHLPGPIHLLQVGWFQQPEHERYYREAAARLAPSVTCLFLDGRDPEIRRDAWRGADLFTTLTDNVQESFGITPVEAMAAGLPVVATDWDGYRDTIVDGETGLLVPTVMAAPGSGADLGNNYYFDKQYSRYLRDVANATAVDVGAAAAAYAALLGDPELRRRMGEAGRRRAKAVYDWPVVIGCYQALWRELAERRRRDARPGRPGFHPHFPDPFRQFAGFATRHAMPSARVRPRADWRSRLPVVLAEPMLMAGRDPAVSPGLAGLLEQLEAAPTIAEITAGLAPGHADQVVRPLVWLMKAHLVVIGE